MHRSFRVGLTVIFMSGAPLSLAANLIPNPDFTQLLTDWSQPPAFAGHMDPNFSTGSPAPPSVHVSGNGFLPSTGISAVCLPADGLDRVDFEFETLVVAGVVRGLIEAYSDAECTNLIDSTPTPDAQPSDAWTTLSLHDVALAFGTRSVRVSLQALSADGVANGDAYFDHVAFGAAGSLPPAIAIDQLGLSGAWYEPTSRGQGFQFSIDPEASSLFGAWYTFDTVAGGTESQRWYSLQASLSPDSMAADVTIYQNTGGRFSSPPQTTATPVGTATLVFDSCTSGSFAYTFDDGRSGVIPLNALLSMSDCFETGMPDVQSGPSGLTSAWYDPASAGQGVLVNIDGHYGTVFVGWYTYVVDGTPSGEQGQRWFSAQGSYGTGSPVALGVYATTGGVFDAAATAITEQVGTATLSFDDCEHATLDFTFTAGDLAGTIGSRDLVRLGAAPATCRLTP